MKELIGYLGGIFIMLSFIPQVIKSYRLKKVDDISIWMVIASLIGTIFWVVYGFLIEAMPVIIMNFIFGIIVIIQLILMKKYISRCYFKYL